MVAPSVICILRFHVAGAVQQRNHIALQIGNIIVDPAIGSTSVSSVLNRMIFHGQRPSRCIIGKPQMIQGRCHFGQQCAAIHISEGLAANGTTGAQAVGIVLKQAFYCPIGHRGQLPALFPCISPTVIICEIAAATVRERVSIRDKETTEPSPCPPPRKPSPCPFLFL